jgi:hypothetical protein
MKIFLFLLIATATAIAVSGYAQDTPPYAASTHTWVFGEQTWSDVIHMPRCNKEDFTNSYTSLQCRSYTEGGNTWYYYNWAYVDANKDALCPSPWRVPSRSDMDALMSATNYSTLIGVWGYGGYALDNFISDENSYTYYWSSTKGSRNINFAYYLFYCNDSLLVLVYDKRLGYQVRCVK